MKIKMPIRNVQGRCSKENGNGKPVGISRDKGYGAKISTIGFDRISLSF
jgi:hypothetical protein